MTRVERANHRFVITLFVITRKPFQEEPHTRQAMRIAMASR